MQIDKEMQILKAPKDLHIISFHLINHGQITAFNGAELTMSGCMSLTVDGAHRSLLYPDLVEEATQLMIDNGIVITNESENVGAL
jgi:hypothetical protein